MIQTRNIFQRNSSWNVPYTFSGKEKDAETGYGYFGARYYDSGLSIWLSVDPMSDKYPSMSPYNYCANNPVILVDPDGRAWEIDGYIYRPNENAPDEAEQSTKMKFAVMNFIYKTPIGKKVIDDLNGEDVIIKINSDDRTNGSGVYQTNGDGSGGTITVGENDNIYTSIAHEIFHAYQDHNNQGGRSLFNEVGANLFSYAVGLGHSLSSDHMSENYKNNLNKLLVGETLDIDAYNNVIDGLLDNSSLKRTTYEVYPRKRDNQNESLIQELFPLRNPVVIINPNSQR